MRISKLFTCVLLVLASNIMMAQTYQVGAYFDKLDSHFKTLQNFDSEVKSYCEHKQQNIIPVLQSDNLVVMGFEQYQLNETAREYYYGFQNLDYIDKCRLIYSWNQYSTVINKVAQDKKIPKEIAYLPVVYTVLDEYYQGPNYRFGIWGLPYLPAVKYGIVADPCYDQRLDISLNSYAALSYLEDLHRSFRTWDLAVTAYCCGPSSVVMAGSDNQDYDSVYNNLNCIDKDCFYRLLAFSKWMEENETFDFSNVGSFSISVTDTVLITTRMHFDQISEVLDIDKDELKSLNPMFVGNVIDGRKKPKIINLPESYKPTFIAMRDSIPYYMDSVYFPKFVPVVRKTNDYNNYNSNTHVSVSPGDDYEEIKYKIVSGDNLGSIAERYNVNIVDLKDWNDIRGTNIWAGQNISIWVKKGTKDQYVQKEKPIEKKPLVTKKDNSVSVKKRLSMDNYRLVGTYEVKSGDSPYKIAQNYSWASPEEIMEWNGVSDPSKLQVGQKLKIYRKKK